MAAWRGVLKYPAADAVPDLFFSMRRRPALIWTLVQHDVGLIDGLRSRREGALRAGWRAQATKGWRELHGLWIAKWLLGECGSVVLRVYASCLLG